MKKNKVSSLKKEKLSLFSIIIFAIMILYSAFLLFLIIWAFISSFKEQGEFDVNVFNLPRKFVTTNYLNAFNNFSLQATIPGLGTGQVGVSLMFVFGFLYALGCAIAATLVPCVVGYVCAKYNYKFSKVIFYVVIICMILPIIGNLPAEITMAKTFGLYGQIWGMWIMKANFLGIYFIIFYNYFKNLPNAYNEAAKIDGAGNFKTMVKVVFPMALPIFSTVLLLNFITFWNDFQTPYIYLSQSYPTISFGMYVIANMEMTGFCDTVFKFACSFLVLIPILIIFLIFNKRLLGNITMGGIKG